MVNKEFVGEGLLEIGSCLIMEIKKNRGVNFIAYLKREFHALNTIITNITKWPAG